jgi:hypothetical protein
MPAFSTLAAVVDAADMFFNSSLMEHRQHHPDGTDQFLMQIAVCHIAAHSPVLNHFLVSLQHQPHGLPVSGRVQQLDLSDSGHASALHCS